MSIAEETPSALSYSELSAPHARTAQTFPTLPQEMVSRIAPFGVREDVEAGTYLFNRGERSVDFFVVLDGAIDIVAYDECGGEDAVHRHTATQFTGEVDMFNDRKILVSGRADGPTRVLRLARPAFRALIAAEPDIGEIIMRAFILRRVALLQQGQGGVTLVGPGHGRDMVRLNAFLTRNAYPHRIIDSDVDEDAKSFLEAFHLTPADLPVVVADGEALRNPSEHDLADRLGLSVPLEGGRIYDLAVVGAGPAGLAAAVYAASEGLGTIVIESTAPGGQAGTSSKIENYLGFPTGISGQALAGRAQMQAQKFGARIAVSRAVTGLNCDGPAFKVMLEDGSQIEARAVVAATGARYRRLSLPDYERFEGAGIHYAATAMEAQLCENEPVIVIGGGNSAGQAAIYLSNTAAHVHMMVRAPGLAATMSHYLIERIEASPRITLHTHTELSALYGERGLQRVRWVNRQGGEETEADIAAIFVMIGAEPNTGWLQGCAELDGKGFIKTGSARSPFETSRPGLFAVGDVRSGSVKRVASGVGEGSVVVQAIHAVLADADEARP